MNQHRQNNDNPDRLQGFKNQQPWHTRNQNDNCSKRCQNAIGERLISKKNRDNINNRRQNLRARIKLMDKGAAGEILS